ncbi:hypothetical protein QYF36_018532 [Acer negundo]|nr:hypothetical protein QYF36_018532 [Acer negundo]
MENLFNLRYLDFSRTYNLEGLPSKIGLENVNDAMDAKEADLSGKKNLTELFLEWRGWIPRKERIQTEVLDMLQPCNEKLEKLTISDYGGTMFPIWPFPKLEILHLSDMNEWEEWISHEDQEDGGLPQLRELIISEFLSLPADCVIEINCCKQVEHRNTIGLSSLNPLVFSDIASHMFLIEQLRQRLSQVEDVHCKLPMTRFLSGGWSTFPVEKCGSLTYLARSKLPPNLKQLVIGFCGELSSMNLVIIRIDECEKLEAFTDNMHQHNHLQLLVYDLAILHGCSVTNLGIVQ